MKAKTILFVAVVILAASIMTSSIAAAPHNQAAQSDPQWAKQAIAEMEQKGYMLGDLKGFGSHRSITRGELAFALDKLFKLDTGDIRFIKAPQATDYYDDVLLSSPYTDAITMCAINNIFKTKDRKFQPNSNVTRIEAAIAIAKCFQAKKVEVFTTMQFPVYGDTNKLTNEESSAMCFVSNSGMMQGYNNNLRPYSPLSRAETAVLLSRAGKVIEQCTPKQ